MKLYFRLRTDKTWKLDKLMHCISKKQLVENLTSLLSFIMKITSKDNDKNDMQLSYKHWNTGFLPRTVAHWTSNACQPQPNILTQKNIIFHCFFITCDLWCFSFRWICIPLVPCRFRDCHSDFYQIFFVWNELSLIVSVPGIAADHGPTVQLLDLVREEWNDLFNHHYCQIHSDPEWYSTW